MKGVVFMLREWLYHVMSSFISRFIHENIGVEVSVMDNGNSSYRTLYVHLKMGNEVVASDYTNLEIRQ